MTTATRSATDLLRSQHDRVEALFDEALSAEGAARQETFDCLRALLAVHETAEELTVHPRARLIGADGERIVQSRLDEEHAAKEALAELEHLTADGADFGQRLVKLRRAVLDHAQAEERELFPLLERDLDDEELQRLATTIEAAEALAPTHAHPHGPDTAVGNLLVGPFVAIADRVRDAIANARSDS